MRALRVGEKTELKELLDRDAYNEAFNDERLPSYGDVVEGENYWYCDSPGTTRIFKCIEKQGEYAYGYYATLKSDGSAAYSSSSFYIHDNSTRFVAMTTFEIKAKVLKKLKPLIADVGIEELKKSVMLIFRESKRIDKLMKEKERIEKKMELAESLGLFEMAD